MRLSLHGFSLLAVASLAAAPLRAQPAAPALTPPRLIAPVEAVYPPAALAERVEGAPVLLLDIDAEGRVTGVSVAEPAGHGFDESASEAARGFRFEPARRGEQAVRSRIRYRHVFALPPAPEPPGAPPAGAAPAPPAGPPDAGASGTEPAAGHMEHPASSPPAAAPDEVVVTSAARRDREIKRYTLGRKELGLVPGTGGDALRAVQTLPGVGRASALDGLLIVRGTRPQSTAVFVDGVWVPSAYHFGGFSSVVPTESIETIDFYPGNFGARYGRAMGGVLDVRLRPIAPDGKTSGVVQVDLIDARALAQGPLPGLPGWGFLIAARRSHLDAWLPSVLSDDVSFRTAPVYYDGQLMLERRWTDGAVRVGLIGSDDRLALVTRDAAASDPGVGAGLASQYGFYRMIFSYEGRPAPHLKASVTAAYGQNNESFRSGPIDAHDVLDSFTLRGDLSYAVASWLTVRGGPDLLYFPFRGEIRAPQPPRPGQPDPGPISARPLLHLRADGLLAAPAAYAELDVRPHPRAKVLLGGRVDHNIPIQDTTVSPRLNARYDLVAGPRRVTVRGGVGLFYEPPLPIEMIDVFGTPTIRSNRSRHTALGVEHELSDQADISLEAFHKKLDQLVVRATLPDGSAGYNNAGTGQIIGLEALLRYRPGGRFFGWLSYTLSRSTRSDAAGQPEHLLEYDQTHNLSAVASYDLGRGFQLGGRLRYVTGTPYTPCVGGDFDATSGAYACRSGALHSARLPAFHQLDIRLDKSFRVGAGRLTAYLELLNAYNRANAEGVGYNFNYTRSTHSYGIPLLPNAGLRGEF